MQVVKNILLSLLVVWFAILLFMPKEKLYFALEKKLEAQDIKINEKAIETGIFSLNLLDADIYVKGIKVAHIKKVNVFTLLFTTNINIGALSVDASLKAFIPEKIEQANIIYTILTPLKADVFAHGSFGDIEGIVDLKGRTVRLDFIHTTKEVDLLRANLQKDEKGLYYETSF